MEKRIRLRSWMVAGIALLAACDPVPVPPDPTPELVDVLYLRCFVDSDVDGYPGTEREVIVTPPARTCVEAGHGSMSTDCDDANGSVHPGAADEPCDSVDSDCDPSTSAVDADGDGRDECRDCDDGDAAVYPGAEEICNGVDDDCNPATDEVGDWDGDGASICDGDCNDQDPGQAVPTYERCWNGLDDDCDGEVDEMDDLDGDGRGCGDCDELDPTVYPHAPELCDGLDNDCDDVVDEVEDSDGDGWADCPASGEPGDVDCAPLDHTVHPWNDEVCNGLDDDCDPATDEGVDSDGDGATICDGDCADTDATSSPGGVEVCDGADNDCDLATDEDFDLDGDGIATCGPDGVAGTPDDDCDDTDASRRPGAVDVAGDGVDSDCDGSADAATCPEGPIASAETDPVVALVWAVNAVDSGPGTTVPYFESRLDSIATPTCPPVGMLPSADPYPEATTSWTISSVDAWWVNAVERPSCAGVADGVAGTGSAHFDWTETPWATANETHLWVTTPYYTVAAGGDALMLAGEDMIIVDNWSDGSGVGSYFGHSSTVDLTVRECAPSPPDWLRRGLGTRTWTSSEGSNGSGISSGSQSGTLTAYADTTPWVASFQLNWSDPMGFGFVSDPTGGSFVEVALHPSPGAPPSAVARLEYDCLIPTANQATDGCGELYVDGLATGCWCPPAWLGGGPP